MTKLKIETQSGILIEVEGEESFVKSIYADYKEKITNSFSPSRSSKSEKKEVGVPKNKVPNTKKRKKTTRNVSFSIVSDVDASALKQFYSEKKPKTKYENNAVFVYFLQKLGNIKDITLDHIYTCYKLVGQPVPRALRQSLVDTSFHKDYINTRNLNSVSLTIVGENFVEHNLPMKEQ